MNEPGRIGTAAPMAAAHERGKHGKKGAKAEAGFAALVKPARGEPMDRKGHAADARVVADLLGRGLFAITNADRTNRQKVDTNDDAIGRVELGLELPPLGETDDADPAPPAPDPDGDDDTDEAGAASTVMLTFLLPADRRYRSDPGTQAEPAASAAPGQDVPQADEVVAPVIQDGDDVAAEATSRKHDAPAVEPSRLPPSEGGDTRAGRGPVETARTTFAIAQPSNDLAGQSPPRTVATDSAAAAAPDAAAPDALVAGSSASPDAGDAESRDKGESRRGPDTPLPKIAIVAEQSAPAPAAPASATSVTLAAAMAGDSGWQAALRSVASLQLLSGQMQAGTLHSMKLQLNPVDLGAVTANLQLVGERLSVEIVVENREAFHRLNADSDLIVSTLRGLGYSVDQVSVTQSPVAGNQNGRSDSQGGNPARDGQDGGAGEGGDRMAGGRGSSGERGGEGRDSHAAGQADRARRGLFI
ncbi:MAG: flagellar hook-length control protein FliK [Rhizobiaceae bacterium]